MKKQSTFIAALAGVCLLLTACGSVNTTGTRTERQGDDSVVVRQDINDLLSSLAIKTREVRLYRNDSGTLEAQVDMANDGFRTRRFSYRFEWLDERGNVIPNQNTAWKAGSIASGGFLMISSTALTPEADDFRLQVRRSN
ncbi:YcfL family protein [Nodularia spumigena]|jgi:uncharacterized protein YcfL|uniref:YcfL family protein n=1 Tax=Nodularia spumigena TaxID=70799 RepID=UPI002B2072BF|nr:YcfL family protein [Nodularia spumigena]MEA5612426.1 YcfL family protein [Nodularia spumigena UHCC 0040]